jgi:hypothetical protein
VLTRSRAWLLLWAALPLGCHDYAALSESANDEGAEGAPAGPIFVSGSVLPDAECVVSTDGESLPEGEYDLALTTGTGDECSKPYVLNLVISSRVPDALQVHSAEIRLLDPSAETVDLSGEPNPFLAAIDSTIEPAAKGGTSKGVVTIETIPSSYREHLTEFPYVEAEVSVFATGTDDKDFDLPTFRQWIWLCDGCLSRCASAPAGKSEPTDDTCMDNAGADGRVCVDDGC